MVKHFEKKIRKWVIGTVDENGDCFYLFRKPQSADYQLVSSIDIAIKAASKSAADLIIYFYYQESGSNIRFVPIPVDITYETIEQ